MRIISILAILFGAISPAVFAADAVPVSQLTQLRTAYAAASTTKVDVNSLLGKTLLGSCYTNDDPEKAISVEFAYVSLEGGVRGRPVILLDNNGYVGMNSRTAKLLTSAFTETDGTAFTVLIRSSGKGFLAEIDATNLPAACGQLVCQSGPSYCQFAFEE